MVRKKNCDHCTKDATIMYRVQIDTSKNGYLYVKAVLII